MASRHLKRLKELHQAEADDEAVVDEDEESPVKAKPSLFRLLDEQEDEETSAESGFEEGEAEEEQEDAQDSKHAEVSEPATSSKSLKKKRNKGKRGGKDQQQQQGKASAPKEEEDLDKLLEAMNIKLQTEMPERSQGEVSTSRTSGALTVNTRKLRPEEELRRIFGSKVVSADAREADDGGQYAGASRRVRRMLARGILRRVQLKQGMIIQPKDHWPKPDDSISMKATEPESDSKQCFSYVFSAAYLAADAEFDRVQSSFDPNAVLQFLSRHPYHLDALLAASDFYRAAGQVDTADDFLARGLYALEMAWPPQFVPTVDRCRLALVDENLAVFNALFRYVQCLTRRGLYATALENAKLLLSLHHLDPEGILHCIDYLAIKAGQYNFVEALVSELGKEVFFAEFPNWVYSLPLAKFLRKATGGGAETVDEETTLMEGARAVMHQPGVVVAVVEKIRDQGVRLDAEFEGLLKEPLFRDADDEPCATLEHLIAIYAERQSALYKNPEILGWLKRCCKAAVACSAGERRDWALARAEIWPPSDENQYAVLRLSRYSDTVAALPEEELQAMAGRREVVAGAGAGGGFPLDEDLLNQLPPEVEQELRDLAGDLNLHQLAERIRAGEQVSEEEVQQMNPFIALVQSLLPWVNFGVDPGAEDGGEQPMPDSEGQQQRRGGAGE